jgi:hypothetical protein
VALAATMPLNSVGFENEANKRGKRYVWPERNVVNRLRAIRGRARVTAT